jgi:uncharacterized protein (TIGR00304 family)
MPIYQFEEAVVDSAVFYFLGVGLVLIGIFILILAIVLIGLRGNRGKVKTAGIIVVGPVPIIFGSDKKTIKTILLLSVTLTILLIVAMLIYFFLLR